MLRVFIGVDVGSAEMVRFCLGAVGAEKYDIFYNENGKPYVKILERRQGDGESIFEVGADEERTEDSNSVKIYFSLSHTDDLILCAVSDKEIGVDIEGNTFRQRIFDEFFSDDEKKYVQKIKQERARAFTEIWTLKEARAKMLGTGLTRENLSESVI